MLLPPPAPAVLEEVEATGYQSPTLTAKLLSMPIHPTLLLRGKRDRAKSKGGGGMLSLRAVNGCPRCVPWPPLPGMAASGPW